MPMSFADDNPGYEIVTPEQAKNWISVQIEALKKVRLGCIAELPGDKEGTSRFQRKAYRIFLEKHGGVLGMLAILCRCQKLSEEAYNKLRSEAMELLGPSLIVGRYDWFSDIKGEDFTEERARNWLINQINALELARLDCNVVYPGDKARTAEAQQTADWRFVVKLGAVLGMIVALHKCRLLGDVAHNSFRTRAMATVVPTLVGTA